MQIPPTCLVAAAALCALTGTACAVRDATTSTTVPIQLVDTEPPLVMVRIEGKELPLQLDLGDESSLVIHPEVLSSLRTVPTGRTAKFFSMDGSFETPILRVDGIEIGSIKIQRVDVRQDTHNEEFLKNKKTYAGAVGFIGTGVLRSGQIELDYSRRTMKISLPDSKGNVEELCRGIGIPLVKGQYGLTTPFATERGELNMGWDTGAPTNLLSRLGAREAKLPADQKSIVFRTFSVSGHDFGPQHLEIWDNIPLPPEISGLMGYPFFNEHVLCFDYARSTLHIQ